jgi:hypothetical protein
MRGGVLPSNDANRPGPTGPGVASVGELRQGWPPVADPGGERLCMASSGAARRRRRGWPGGADVGF